MLVAVRVGYYRHPTTWKARAGHQAHEKRTVSEIRAIRAEHHGTHGVLRVHAELRARERRINRKRVTRLMRVNHIVGRHLKKKRTTIADSTAPPAPDLVIRDFNADALNTGWCADSTYMAVGTTCPYAAMAIGICLRLLVGWSIADPVCTSLAADTVEMAVAARSGRVNGGVFHTDRGSHYSSRACAEACSSAGVRRRMSAVGSSADKALAASFNATFKRGTLQGRKGRLDEREPRLDAFRWHHCYNTRRPHSRLRQRSPIVFENAFHLTPTTLAPAA